MDILDTYTDEGYTQIGYGGDLLKYNQDMIINFIKDLDTNALMSVNMDDYTTLLLELKRKENKLLKVVYVESMGGDYTIITELVEKKEKK